MLVCGQRICLLQVLQFCCSVCQWFTNPGQISGMMRYEDYSFWSRYLPLVNWIRWTLCRIVEKERSLPEICCSKDRSEINFFKITRTWCSIELIFFQSWHMSICQKASITQWKHLKKHLLKFMFLDSPNDKRFYSYLGTSVRPSPMNILFTSYYQNISFRNTAHSQKFEARFFLRIISC